MIKLYGVIFSPYTAKVRAYLQYKNISYREVFANWYQYLTVIKRKTGVMYIPVVSLESGEILQDSSVIIDYFESEYTDDSITPPGAKQQLASALLENYGDEWMVPFSCLHYRWNYPENLPVLFPQFGRVALKNGPKPLRSFLGKKISERFRGFMPKLGLTAEICEGVEQRHEQLLGLLNKHFAEYDYLLGGRACMGDFALFGPLYAHLYLDPAPRKVMDKLAPNVVAWVERMANKPQPSGEFLTNDEVPADIEEIIKIVAEDLLPLLLEAAVRVDDWAQKNPSNKVVPGALSGMEFSLAGKSASRMVLTAPVWKLQRTLTCVQSHSEPDWLRGLGAGALVDYQQQSRVLRRKNKVEIA